MANNQNIQRTITVNTNAQQTNQQLGGTQQLLQQLVQTNQQLNQTVAQGAQAQSAGLAKLEKSANSLAKGFKGIGLAFKSIGIGLILDALGIVKDLFQSNQAIVDGFSNGINFLTIAFSDLVSFISKSAGPVSKYFKELFDDPIKSVKNFGNAVKENLIERFKSYADTLGFLAKGIQQLFSGDFAGALKSLNAAGKETIDVFTGVNNTFDRVSSAVKEGASAIADYTSKTYKQAAAMTDLANRNKLAIATNEELLAGYEKQAEDLRRRRDDENLSLNLRIEASKKLKKVLDEEIGLLRANAKLAIQEAQNNLALNKTVENEIKLKAARTKLKELEANISGQLSEQQQSEIGLQKENIELTNLQIDGDKDRAISEREYTDSLLVNNKRRIAAEKETILADQKATIANLELKKSKLNEGTLAYEEANQDILNAQQEFDQKLAANTKSADDAEKATRDAKIAAAIDNDKSTFEARLAALDEQQVIINATVFASEEARTAALKANTDKRMAIEQSALDQKQDIANQELDIAIEGVGVLKMVSEKNKDVQKALIIAENAAGIAKIIINTLAANAKAVAATPLTGGQPFVTLNTIQGAVGVAGTIAATAKALSALGGGSAGSSGSGAALSGGGASSAPSFNTVGASGQNQLAETIAAQQGNVPVAQVVSSQVTTQQALDRQVINNATFI